MDADTGSSSQSYSLYGLSPVFVVKQNPTEATANAISIVSSPALGDTYRLGEVIEFEVTFSSAVEVEGTPQLALVMRDGSGNTASEFTASYARGTGTTKLVFAYTVAAGDRAAGGIATSAAPLQLNGAAIWTLADSLPARLALTASAYIQTSGNRSQVDGSLGLTGGVCGRTLQVRDAIVAAVSAASDCSLVSATHLAGIGGSFSVIDLTSLKAGDLDGLSGLDQLSLFGSGVETLPAGLFDDLDSLIRLRVGVGLTRLPKDIFRGLDKADRLFLDHNSLAAGSLPDGVLEPLTKLDRLNLTGNPGSASFKPVADAGSGGTLTAGETVTLGGPGTAGGPWGSNVTYAWTQTDGEGTAASTVTLSATKAANPTFTVPALAAATDVNLSLTVTGRGEFLPDFNHTSKASTATFTIRALAPTAVALVSKPLDGGDEYHSGENIEVAVTFGDRVLVAGEPELALTVGANARQAIFVRGSGTNRLVFEYPVVQTDMDTTDGIAIAADSLTLAGGAIVSVHGTPAILDHTALTAQSGHKVNGSTEALTGGICGRTAQVRDELVDLVNDVPANSGVTNCSQVTTGPSGHLAALSGTLDLSDQSIAVLKRGDFAGLSGITRVPLDVNDLTALPEGVFDGLGSPLTFLDLGDNDLRDIPSGVFDGLTGLRLLGLNGNDLVSLPPRIFEPLKALIQLVLRDNPGSARFVPTAKAGPEGGIEVASGGTVTLGVEGAAAGFDDPWGDNIESWAWTRTTGTGGTLADTATARATFTAPTADETLTFTLTVTGKGGFTTTSTVDVRVAAGPTVTGVAFASSPAASGGYGLGEHIDVALRFDRPVRVDTAGGTPSVALTVGTERKTAAWLGGSGSRAPVFRYTVQAADTDIDGVDLVADSLALNGGTILGVSDGGAAALGHAALAGGTGRRVQGGTPVGSTGICGRTPAVQSAILARVQETHGTVASCAQVMAAHLSGVGGTLDVSAQAVAHGRMTALGAGDFDDLTGVTALDLDNHAIRAFPAGIFRPLTGLTSLSIAYNQTQASDSLMTLPAGLFDDLTRLTTLRLEQNDLATLPAKIFEKLTALTTLTFQGNPGTARFLPVAVAGPAGGLDAKAGDTVTLGGDAGGPWGNNLVYAWSKAADTAVNPSATGEPRPTLTAPALAEAAELEYELTVTARGTSLTATDRVTVRVAAAVLVSSVALVSKPIVGDTYKRGETIEAAVTFGDPVKVVTSLGTPTLALTVGTNTRQALFVPEPGTGDAGTEHAGTRRLVFEYTVVEADADGDGIAVAANRITLNGGTIAGADGAVAILTHAALAAQSGHKVGGTPHEFEPTAGICGRTAPVRDKLVELVRTAQSDTSLTCATVTTGPSGHLAALSGTLDLSDQSIAVLKRGDFAGLSGITRVPLDVNDLTALPEGVFDGLGSPLTFLDLGDNDLRDIPSGVFDGLTGLRLLGLNGNDLVSLPPRIFEPLKALIQLVLRDNPGSARFVPTAKAGPEGGIEVASGGTVTLGVEGAADGFDDPWGDNVAYSWAQSPGTTTVTYETGKGAATARPEFTAPAADETHTFTLTVTGKGGSFTATSRVSVRVGEARTQPMPESAVVNGATLTLTYDEALQETYPPASAPDKGPVYLAVISDPGAQRSIETAQPDLRTPPQVSGRTVTIALDRPVEYGQRVTLSYFRDNAVERSKVRDLGGSLANAFSGFQVRNETPEGPHVDDVAFAGTARTYKIGDTVEIDVTFSEAVRLTGAPTLDLTVGAATRKAVWKAGQAAGAVQRFEYTVVEGDEDTERHRDRGRCSLETPSGSSIVTVAGTKPVNLSHGRTQDPARPVDGMRPTASSAAAAGRPSR